MKTLFFPLFRVSLVCIAVCAGMIAAALRTAPILPADMIAFVSDREGNNDIFVLDIARGAIKNLTHHPAADTSPDWSPDGTQIVFHSDRDGDSEIYVIDADGGNVRALTFNGAYDGLPDWSPDGTQIAFISNRDNAYDLYVMDTQGNHLRRLTTTSVDDLFPAWSPDGAQIAVSTGGVCLVWVDVVPGLIAQTRCLPEPGFARDLSWSPDGASLVVSSPERGDFNLYLLPADGTAGMQQITSGSANDLSPAWLPDGAWVVFSSDRAGQDDLYRVEVTTGQIRRLTHTPFDERFPVWRP